MGEYKELDLKHHVAKNKSIIAHLDEEEATELTRTSNGELVARIKIEHG